MYKIFVAVFLCWASISKGAQVSFLNTNGGVWNTGLNNSGEVRAGGSSDPHYILFAPAGCQLALVPANCSEDGTSFNSFGPTSYVVQGSSGTYPFDGTWGTTNDAAGTLNGSAWVGPRADQSNPLVGGSYPNIDIYSSTSEFFVYRLAFNLTGLGLDPTTASIKLKWLADSVGTGSGLNSEIRLCGIASAASPVCASGTVAGSAPGSASLTGFGNEITILGVGANLQALDFIVYNAPVASGRNPSGMRVNFVSATAYTVGTGPDTNPVPEPAGLGIAGLAGLVLADRYLKRRA